MAGSVVMLRSPLPFLFFYVLATTATAAAAASFTPNITADEEYWARRAEVARAYSRAAYVSDPVAVLNRFNEHVLNTTATTHRRSLAGRRYRGPCAATNPIDRCWRCRANWANHRKRLARCAMGFGHKATGGLSGRIYVVTDPSDDFLIVPRRGTLRHAVVQDRPLWIVFARDMVIRLSAELIVTSDKTIDGRGAQVHITGAQITVQSVRNVILHSLRVHHSAPRSGGPVRDSEHHFGVRGRSDGDGISVLTSSHVWIDHVSMWNCSDGLIDVVDGSTAVTISNSHFTRHDHVMRFGANDDPPKDRMMQITVAFNHFGKGLVQRMPRCRYGFFHVVNNDYTQWLMYAIGGSRSPTIISQGNRFRAGDDARLKEVTKREHDGYGEYRDWVWRSTDDLFLNGAFFTESGGAAGENGQRGGGGDALDIIQARNGRYAAQMTRFAGALDCRVGERC